MDLQQDSLKVVNLSRDSAENVKSFLQAINGVKEVIVSLENSKVLVEYDNQRISLDLLRDIIQDHGYEVK